MKEAILKWLAVAAVLALALWLAVRGYESWRTTVHGQGYAAGAAYVRSQWDDQKVRQAAEAVESARQSAAETLRRLNKQQENDRAQQIRLAQARRDAAGAAASADGLRLRAAAYLDAAGCGNLSGDPAIECIRTAAAKVADALGRVAERARRAAADADDARERGLRCEADYDALILKASAPP